MTFTIDGEDDLNHFMACAIKVGLANYNDKPTQNAQCPVTEYYHFSVTGYNEAYFWVEIFVSKPDKLYLLSSILYRLYISILLLSSDNVTTEMLK